MKTRSIVLLAAVLACAACSRKPETPTAGTPTPAPTPAPVPPAIYITDRQAEKVLAFSPSGAPLAGFTPPTGLDSPWSIAFNPANHTLYECDHFKNTIRTFDALTGAETQIGFANAPGLQNPLGVALADGKLYVANWGAFSVLAFDAATGKPVTSGFTSPDGVGTPQSVAVSGTTLYVAGSKVGAYDLATGKPAPGFTPISLGEVSGLALHGNALFISVDGKVGVYDATTGAVLNADFLPGIIGAKDLAFRGDHLYVVHYDGDGMIGTYDVPAEIKKDATPKSSAPTFVRQLGLPVGLTVAP